LTAPDLKEYFRKMAFRNYVEMTDPAVIRALAHPARAAILAFLSDGPATATECSEAADESPSSCSYHLRTLAKLGFVEETASEDGRERRWRLKIEGHGIPKSAQESPAATFSSHEVHLTPNDLLELAERFTAMLKPFLDRKDPDRRPEGARPVHVTLTAFPRHEDPARRRKATLRGARRKKSRGRSR
jgi:DNA-binding transcriptional ArsR family regulator